MELRNDPSGGQSTSAGAPERLKFAAALVIALTWTLFSIWVSARWMEELGRVTSPLFALFAITFVAYVPGFMNTFLAATLLLDRRPQRVTPTVYPGLTLLVAAYQEREVIAGTLASIWAEDYPGPVEVLVLNDGSTDGTGDVARAARRQLRFAPNVEVRVIDFPTNRGKAAVLNSGLGVASHDLIVTIDADTELEGRSLRHLVERLLADPPHTMAVAGAVLVRNAHDTLLAGAQQWDYFHGIAAVKRMQSLYNGTLVAQGAFSIYRKSALQMVGGWPACVGEDIVLTWALLERGWRIGYAEDAIVFTNVPTTVRQFAQQRKRWSRGLVEALNHHEGLLFKPRLTLMFIWWNLLFLPLDLAFTLIFIPGVIAAAFGIFWIAGPMTLLVLPLAGLWNIVTYRIQSAMAHDLGLDVRHNLGGLAFYLMVYAVLMQPVCVWGYASELAGRAKRWGTK